MVKVKRILNNNALVAEDRAKELILTGLGIAFGLKKGDEIDIKKAEKVWTAEDDDLSRISAILADIPPIFLSLSLEIYDLVQKSLPYKVRKNLLIALTEHLFYADKRMKEGRALKNPLVFEIRHIYPKEFKLASQAVALIKQKTGVDLGGDEVGFIALHIINSIGAENMNSVMQSVELVQKMHQIVKKHFPNIDKDELAFSRFLTHLLYLASRILADRQEKEEEDNLFKQIAKSYPQTIKAIDEVEEFLISAGYREIRQIEKTYLILHIQRALHHDY